MKTIRAVYENSVFRPLQVVELPERTHVEFEPRQVIPSEKSKDGLDEIYAILSERYQSGHPDTAARHNEHQP